MTDEDAWLERWARDPELRQAAHRYEAELRAEAAEYEQLAAKDRLRGRTLTQVAAELLVRGDLVTVALASRSFTGQVIHAAGDLACLRTAAGTVDVNLGGGVALSVVEPVRRGGTTPSRGAQSFVARLAEHEAAGGHVEVGARLACHPHAGGWAVIGQIEAVAADHVVVTAEGTRSYLAFAAVDYVRPH